MTNRKRSVTVASACAALGLTSLTPVQQGAALVAAGSAALWVSPAMASLTIPGVGIVVKKKPGNSPIIVLSDGKGEVRLTGLEPGTYTVQVFGGAQEAPMQVGPDGQLAFVAWEDIQKPNPRSKDPRARRALPVVKRWAEQIAQPGPCNEPYTCGDWSNAVDLNTASAEEIAKLTGTSIQSAVHIMVQREKGGEYTSIEDFARRNCRTNEIAMSSGAVKIGDATFILAPSVGKPIVPGFQCKPGGKEFELYGKRHDYVGHITLLR